MCGATSPTHHHPTLSHPNMKGRVTTHSPPPSSPIQSRGAAPPPPPLPTPTLSHPDVRGRVTAHSPPPSSPIQSRGAASPPCHATSPLSHHHLPLPSKREGPCHHPLATTTLSHSDARGRVPTHSPSPW